jgi:hypothetical protein
MMAVFTDPKCFWKRKKNTKLYLAKQEAKQSTHERIQEFPKSLLNPWFLAK